METLVFPNPKLKRISTPITVFDSQLSLFAHDLLLHCFKSEGLGMAAPQVGEAIRLVVVNIDHPSIKKEYPSFLVNPQILNPEGVSFYKEGCLSLPGIHARVKRYNSFTLTYQTLEGVEKTLQIEDVSNNLFGTVVQHEVDHLNGLEFIDRLDVFELSKISNKINKRRKK